MSDWIRKGEAELEQDRYLYLPVVSMIGREQSVLQMAGTQKLMHFNLTMRKLTRACLYTFIMKAFSPERGVLWSTDTNVAIMCQYHVFRCNIAELFLKTGVSQHQ